jgi:hypothetical protein
MRTPLLAAALALTSVTGCVYTDGDCTPTTTDARPASKVNVSVTSRSAVITATLKSADGALASRTLTFDVLDDDAGVYTADASTGSDGTARVDLKRADPDALLAIARADKFRASFTGDGTYCASADEVAFSAVR